MRPRLAPPGAASAKTGARGLRGRPQSLCLHLFPVMTGHVMPPPDILKLGLNRFAISFGIQAACVESAAARRIDRARHIAGENDALLLDGRVWAWHRREQRLGIRMGWILIELPVARHLDDLA